MSIRPVNITPGTGARHRPAGLVALALALIALLVGASGCGDDTVRAPGDPVVCTAEVVPGLYIDITDAATGRPAACGASVVISDGAYVETATDFCDQAFGPLPPSWMLGAFERPGEYTIVIKAPGYDDWRQEGVVVTADECHVQQVRIDAELMPAQGQ